MSSRYKEVREDIPILEVLIDIGAAERGWGRGGWNEWTPITCPFCTDSNNSASYNAAAGRFLCHQCGAPLDGKSGDVVDVAKFFLGLDMRSARDDQEAIEWLTRRFRR